MGSGLPLNLNVRDCKISEYGSHTYYIDKDGEPWHFENHKAKYGSKLLPDFK